MRVSGLPRRLRDLRIGQPLVLLLVAVVVPSACVLWFMNEAVRNQAVANQRSVSDAYRGQLRLLRGRLTAHWESRAADLESRLTLDPQSDFQKIVTSGAADAAVQLGEDGRPVYPSLAVGLATEAPMPSERWLLARAAQQSIGEFVQSGNRARAIAAIQRSLASGYFKTLDLDMEGRSIVADEQLLLLSLLSLSDPRRPLVLTTLTALVNDYAGTRLSAAQRVFVMTELQAQGANQAAFPTLEGERLALRYLETDRPYAGGVALRPTADRDAWQLSSPNGRVVGLYRTSTVQRSNDAVLRDQASPTVAFVSLAPGESTDDEAIAIGAVMPGWAMTFVVRDPAAFAGQALARRNSYLAVALFAIGAIAVVVAAVVGGARRQTRLAALRTDLVSTVSHELKTPLASMRLLVDSLLEDPELDAAKTRDYLKLMATENGRLTRLIENFLTFSRLERSRHQFTFTHVSADAVVRDALAAMTDERRARAPRVEVEPELPMVIADRDALVTVLLNLLDNAYKYSPADETVSIRVFREQRFVVFAVADHGIGIPAREHRRIFRWFYRVDDRLARQASGTGLGLSIVQAIAKAHGGRVRVRSQPAQGSTFEVCVPCATTEG